MANELAVFGGLSYSDSLGQEASLYTAQDNPAYFTITGKIIARLTQTVGTSEEALLKGDISTLGYIVIRNLDESNYCEIRPATAGADTVRLDANGGIAIFKFGSDAQTPFIVANTDSVKVEYLLIST